jgi:hypothetical protein
MTNRAIRDVAVWFCTVSCLTAISCSHAATGRSFLASKSGIDVRETGLCASAVIDNNDCRPEDFGRGHWEKYPSFPPYSVPERYVDGSEERVVAEVRRYYLGSPFYAGDVHTVCKRGTVRSAIPPDGTSLQNYELASVIEDRAVRDVTGRLKSALVRRNAADASSISRRFSSRLTDEVRERVRAKVVWFVARYPGGMPDMMRNEDLRRCVQEVQENPTALMVTGVAGYVVYSNHIDQTIGSETTVYRALDSALAGHEDVTLDANFRRNLALLWRDDVDRVASIKMARSDLSTVAYPLWVQFETGPMQPLVDDGSPLADRY